MAPFPSNELKLRESTQVLSTIPETEEKVHELETTDSSTEIALPERTTNGLARTKSWISRAMNPRNFPKGTLNELAILGGGGFGLISAMMLTVTGAISAENVSLPLLGIGFVGGNILLSYGALLLPSAIYDSAAALKAKRTTRRALSSSSRIPSLDG